MPSAPRRWGFLYVVWHTVCIIYKNRKLQLVNTSRLGGCFIGFSFAQFGGLTMVLNTDKDIYSPGEPVRIRLFKLNNSFQLIILNYPTAQRYDFAVTGSTGEVWRWSSDRVFAPFVQQITLLPGHSLHYTEIWPQIDNNGVRVPPGVYRITGWNTFKGFEGFPILSTFIQIG